ncbi:hypothetical protein, partial [Burkholderia sp. SIMBA_048]|uniref:hypothetical protein n=1 Tax=Burkholderia sp. SIMBA_048 TaxID=3085789 RepID=UPI003979C768
ISWMGTGSDGICNNIFVVNDKLMNTKKLKFTKLVFFKVEGLFRDKNHEKFECVFYYQGLHRFSQMSGVMFVCGNNIGN